MARVYGTQGAIRPLLDGAITRDFADLEQHGKIIAEYVWIDGTGTGSMRSKSRTLNKVPKSVNDLPDWNYDGSSCAQAPGEDSEVTLKPCAMYPCPFRRGDNILVMCDVYKPKYILEDGTVTDHEPLESNTRFEANRCMEIAKSQEPWFGIEQEYTLLSPTTMWPLGWPVNGFPAPQGPYYCSAGAGCAIGRDIADAHYKACLFAKINISGVNAEVMPGQWEYQVGPCTGIESGDQLWMSRYLMYRIAEMFNVIVSFDPKPVPGDWNGAGGHVNYSNNDTRKANTGWDAIQAQCEKLRAKHAIHIAAYGEGNERRLTGAHETSSMDDFSWAVANRGCSIRIPRMVPVEKCGYYEDRRPASNLDPYVVTGLIVKTTLVD
jgi:glutamine synthetase